MSRSRSISPLHDYRRNESNQIHSQDYREQSKVKVGLIHLEDSILADMKGKEHVIESTGVIQKAEVGPIHQHTWAIYKPLSNQW